MNWFKARFREDGEPHGVVLYLLILVLVVQTIYPITIGENPITYVIYNVLYAMLMFSGVLVTRNSPKLMIAVIVLGIAWLVYSIGLSIYLAAFNTLSDLGLGYVVALSLTGLFQLVVMQSLVLYIFRAQVVTRDVLFAAVAVYWLLGGFFASIFGVLEGLTFSLTGQNAFVDGNLGVTGEITPWQSTLYYSYATLTTLGYGDVLPVTGWARSIASVEAGVGVMYTTIIMARLVGIYVSDTDSAVVKEKLPHES